MGANDISILVSQTSMLRSIVPGDYVACLAVGPIAAAILL